MAPTSFDPYLKSCLNSYISCKSIAYGEKGLPVFIAVSLAFDPKAPCFSLTAPLKSWTYRNIGFYMSCKPCLWQTIKQVLTSMSSMFVPLVKCPEGSFSQDGRCTLCPAGTYQEQAGSSACTPCPRGRTTIAAGAYSKTLCKLFRALWRKNLST